VASVILVKTFYRYSAKEGKSGTSIAQSKAVLGFLIISRISMFGGR
jgi:hypothetical protein